MNDKDAAMVQYINSAIYLPILYNFKYFNTIVTVS